MIGNEWQLPGQTIEISKEYGLKSTVSKMIAYPTKRAKESNAGKFNSDCVHFLRKYKSNYLQQVRGQLTRKQPRVLPTYSQWHNTPCTVYRQRQEMEQMLASEERKLLEYLNKVCITFILIHAEHIPKRFSSHLYDASASCVEESNANKQMLSCNATPEII